MASEHTYAVTVKWTGNRGSGTSGDRDYDRSHEIVVAGKPVLEGSSDSAFRGDPARHNPEDLLVASLPACHMLWYLHLCGAAGVVVVSYEDHAEGEMEVAADGGGRFQRVVLRPTITLAPASDAAKAGDLHEEVHAKCFIAASVNFPVEYEPVMVVAPSA